MKADIKSQKPQDSHKESKGQSSGKKIFVSYIDDNDRKVQGVFDAADILPSGALEIRTGRNLIRIPHHRWNKTKEESN